LLAIKSHSSGSKGAVRAIRENIVKNSMKAMLLERKKKNLMQTKLILTSVLRKYTMHEQSVKQNIENGKFNEAFSICSSSISELDQL